MIQRVHEVGANFKALYSEPSASASKARNICVRKRKIFNVLESDLEVLMPVCSHQADGDRSLRNELSSISGKYYKNNLQKEN